ncbi:MAG: DUF4302 domain-containing protein [Mangrovibacterium sp.]
MRKLYYSIFYSLVTIMFISCANVEDDTFGSSSSDRIDVAIATSEEILTSKENGWLMEYYPGTNQPYGGYNILMKFDPSGTVSISSELYPSTQVNTSFYTITQSAGVVLSFDTYNEIFHFFADPSDPSGVGGRGIGLEGDYDFQIMEATSEKVVLRGKKSGELTTLTPYEGDWSDYITDINAAEDLMLFSDLTLSIGEQSIPIASSYRVLTFTLVKDDEEETHTVGYIVTKTGYKLYEPIEINGKTITEFIYNVDSDSFTEVNDDNITLSPVILPFNEQFVDNYWYVAYSRLGSFAQPYFNDCKEGLKSTYDEEMNYVYIGYESNGSFGLNFSSSGNIGVLIFRYSFVGKDKITLQFDLRGNSIGGWYYNQAETGVYRMLIPFGYKEPRTFTLTVDRPSKPTYITLTEDANPTNVITLSAERVNNPFDN